MPKMKRRATGKQPRREPAGTCYVFGGFHTTGRGIQNPIKDILVFTDGTQRHLPINITITFAVAGTYVDLLRQHLGSVSAQLIELGIDWDIARDALTRGKDMVVWCPLWPIKMNSTDNEIIDLIDRFTETLGHPLATELTLNRRFKLRIKVGDTVTPIPEGASVLERARMSRTRRMARTTTKEMQK